MNRLSQIFFGNIVSLINVIFTHEIMPLEIGQTVSQVKLKRWRCILLNEALSAYMFLFTQMISFLSLSLGMIVLLLVTLPTDPYIGLFLHFVFPDHHL